MRFSSRHAFVLSSNIKYPDQIPGLWAWWAQEGVQLDGTNNYVENWFDLGDKHIDLVPASPSTRFLWDYYSPRQLWLPRGGTGLYMHYTGSLRPAIGNTPRTVLAALFGVVNEGDAYAHVFHYGADQTREAYGLCTNTHTGHTGGFTGPGNHYWNDGMGAAQSPPTSMVVVTHYDGTRDIVRVNGQTLATKTVSLNTQQGVLRLGSRVGAPFEYYRGFYAEVIVYGHVAGRPTLGDIMAVENYLNQRWRIY
ncbi:MAG: hypothetical protein NZP34_00345 [Caldilineales bacterium]|nr:hypothetical protein [Caldilineales bacterium]